MRVAIGVPPLWCSLPDMRPTDASALLTHSITRAGLLCLLRLWYGGPSDRENPAIFYDFPSMRDARRPDDVVSLACEEMFFLREDDLNASLEQDAERSSLLARAP